MFARLLFLASLLCLSSLASANEFADKPSVSVSGFVYTTQFSDRNFNESRSIAAINVDADYKNAALRFQVGNYEGDPVRRAVLEYAMPIGERSDVVYQVGRFSRVDSFFNGTVDNPASSQMAILPFAGYNYRMFNGAFVLMDGQQVTASTRIGDGAMVRARLAAGKMYIPSQNDLQQETFHKSDPEISIEAGSKAFDMALALESERWHAYASRYYYAVDTTTTATDRLHQYIVNQYADVGYVLDRFGVRYDSGAWFLQGETSHGVTESHSKAGVLTKQIVADDFNAVVGVRYGDGQLYTGRSRGFNRSAGTQNNDSFVGYTHNWRRVTGSIAYHKGVGTSWVHYGYNEPYVWNTFVGSLTYRF